MPPRAALFLSLPILLAACDPSAREVSVEKSQPPTVPARFLEQGRSGVVILADQSYPLSIQTCAIGEAGFMVIGEAVGGEGQRIGVKADGNATSVAVLVRRQAAKAIVGETYRSRFGVENVRVENRTISGSGNFQLERGGEMIPGELTVRCG